MLESSSVPGFDRPFPVPTPFLLDRARARLTFLHDYYFIFLVALEMRGGGGNEVSGGKGKSGGMDGWGIKHHILVRCVYSSTEYVLWVDPGIKAPTSCSIVHTCSSGLLYPGSSLWILMSKRIQSLPPPAGQAQKRSNWPIKLRVAEEEGGSMKLIY